MTQVSRKIRMGMVGGGQGAFIGAVHRMAAAIDGQIELVCGAFSGSADKSIASGRELFLPADRCYADFAQMLASEAALPADQRMDFVSIVTPNHLHFPVARAALEAGFHVLSDKPATLTLDEALKLQALLEKTGLLYGLTHPYTGYPMVKEARERIARSELGALRKVVVEYPQGWLAEAPAGDNKQAAWRLDPQQSGVSACMGDIGVHAANLAEYVCNAKISEICADLSAFVPGRELDDDGNILLRFNNGAKGVLFSSQVAAGEENAIAIRVYGEKGGLEWHQQEPNSLTLKFNDRPMQILRSGWAGTGDIAAANTRTPAGHPEGYLEAFANLYRNFANLIRARIDGVEPDAVAADMPGIGEAVRGMSFIENTVAASASDQKWHTLPDY